MRLLKCESDEMTRINLVDPKLLADQHLFAEWREIKHVPAALDRRLETHSFAATKLIIPPRFTLNKGHMTFFMDKMDYLANRYMALTDELDRRKVVDYSEESLQNFYEWMKVMPDAAFMSNWKPDAVAVETVVERIKLRLSDKPTWYRYEGVARDMDFFSNLLEKA